MLKRFLALLLLLPGSAMAVDGVREINQACALAGCFPGDAPGFPVQIEEPGSYVLTGNLDVGGSANASGIDVDPGTVGAVFIDLNGFSISGPVSCTGTPVTSCSPSGGVGVGVAAPFSQTTHVTVRNGAIRGMGINAVFCGSDCAVLDLVAEQNGGEGIALANGTGSFRRIVTRRNGGDGMFVKGTIEDVISEANGGRGVFGNPYSRMAGVEAIGNAGNGVRCFSCSLLDSVIQGNGGVGVQFGGQPIYGRNLIDDNDGGEISGTALQVDVNRCGTAAC